ncbi:GGDEF domain-containing protein [Faunimonas pinastri]|uniref:GGDEF domain-containing protein n=1 Tax=Faunimonas pinastri TaxID=1855383 RepID=UPI001EEC7C8E|nr:GGDEF domain-containing protein [Faunimonas pinastri]
MGTLLVAAAMTFWERRLHPARSRELAVWALSYVSFAAGCVVAMNRYHLPGISGWALANLIMVLGYLLLHHGVASLEGKRRFAWSAAVLAVIALVWTVGGDRFTGAFWNYLASLPIAAVCGMTAWTLLRSRVTRALAVRPLAVAIFAVHAAFNLARAFLAPVMVSFYGESLLPVLAKATMYEGVLYSVAVPMALIGMVREEAQGKLAAAAHLDYLTGLHNRRGFFEKGGQVIDRCGSGRSVCLLAFDLDHFKAINDRYGHKAGDDVLRLFADVARETLGPEAILARIGGEEFAALMIGQEAEGARPIGENVALRFAEAAAHADRLAIPATVSIGLAELSAGSPDLQALLSTADRALYQAKALGRNRVEVADPQRRGRCCLT